MCGERFDGGNHSKKATMPPVQNPSHLESCRYFTGSRLSSTFNSRCLCGFCIRLWRVYYSTAPPQEISIGSGPKASREIIRSAAGRDFTQCLGDFYGWIAEYLIVRAYHIRYKRLIFEYGS